MSQAEQTEEEQMKVFFDDVSKFKKRLSKVITSFDSPQVMIIVMLDLIEHFLINSPERIKDASSEMIIQWATSLSKDLGYPIEKNINIVTAAYEKPAE